MPAPVDVEAIVASFLRAQPEVTAIVEQRVYTDLPNASDRTYPLVLLTRTSSAFTAHGWIETVALRIDAWGTNHGQARTLASAVVDTMLSRLARRYPEGAVTLARAGSLAYEPDDDSADQAGHARPRYVALVNVTAHP